jgi:lysyl-tRNA synthetase class 1
LGFTYELFLDENGEKISKSRGNGITIDEWLRYATPESLMLFLYQHPKKAKKLFFDVIPKHVDDYESFIAAFRDQRTRRSWATRSGTSTRASHPRRRCPSASPCS